MNTVVVTTGNATEPMTAKERKALVHYERTIAEASDKVASGFLEMARAFYEIRGRRLYRESSPTFSAYFKQRWNYGRSHAHRIADAGEMLGRLSPQGDILELMTSEAHFRPLGGLDEVGQQGVVDLAQQWRHWRPEQPVEPALLRSARAFLNPPVKSSRRDAAQETLVTRFTAIVDDVEKRLPASSDPSIRKLFTQIRQKAAALAAPRSSTGIAWTTATWNPLQGCTRVSAGCDRCYAAKLIATRMADMYPGLAVSKVGPDGTTSYHFVGQVILLPEDLGQPLHDLTPKRYFVNSMSDLFHVKVPEDFIAEVFAVMKKAHWHQFQVLTKRPQRMAEFTARYFENEEPPPNIWLGTSTEDQKAFDARIEWLRKTRAAVRWLSCEPLLGPIKFDRAEGIDWVVVGGESDSDRQMKAAWATGLRDQCAKADIPFFFKQWGSFDEAGVGPKREKHDKLTPPTLEGVIHNAFPV